MTIALTPFEALCGFRPLEEINHHLSQYPELAALAGTNTFNISSDEAANKAELKKIFGSLMNSADADVAAQIQKLTARLQGSDQFLDQLLLRLDSQYPGGDVGVFAALLLNHVNMAPGQGMFLKANEPHAYLSGDCVECMAASDNVVRAGLTPKFKDVNVLVEMLTYRYGSAESQKMNPEPFGSHSLLYDPPIEEFSVLATSLQAGEREQHKPIAGPSILIVTRGSGKLTGEQLKTESDFDLEEGYVYFIGANTPIAAEASTSLEFYRAFAQ